MTGAMASITPTILTSKSSTGTVPSTRLGNVAWSDDGQCLVLSKKEVVIMTPHLVSSLPPPPSLVDPNMVIESAMSVINRGKKGYGAVKDDPDDEPVAESSTSYKPQVRKVKGRQVQWWTNTVELAQATRKDARYQWGDVGRDADWMLRDEDVTPRQAVWSPSGLSDLGGLTDLSCMIAILNTAGQVSVYTPRGDPVRTQWDEVVDLTYSTKTLFRPRIPGGHRVSNAQMREMQTTYLAWSPSLQHESAIGLSSSLLALADRSNQVGFWSYGPDRRFHRVALVNIGTVWATSLAWSDWRDVGNKTCEARLAFSTSTGTVGFIPVRLAVSTTPAGQKYLETFGGQTRIIDQGDKRRIAALKWIDGVLVWTKPGSVHVWHEGQRGDGLHTVKLERVGNWAGCNGLGPCVGINRISANSIAVVLSSLTVHIIHDFMNAPRLAPIGESLVATLAARQAFLDHVLGDFESANRSQMKTAELDLLTAHTAAWADIGVPGISTVNWEAINFHNLDTANEGKRLTAFTVFDMTDSLPGGFPSALESLRHCIDSPTNRKSLVTSPARQLLPHVLRLVVTPPDQVGITELLELCDSPGAGSASPPVNGTGLTYALFGASQLNTLRIKYALSSWCARTYTSAKADFETRSLALLQAITIMLLLVIIRHLSTKIQAVSSGSLDHRLVRALIASHRRTKLPAEAGVDRLVGACPPAPENDSTDRCPACRQPVDEGDLYGVCRCPKGHEWTRCSVTGLLVTTPTYRTCTTCPAIALLPSRITRSPIPVNDQGQERDHERFVKPIRQGEELTQEVLESCQSCITCGGRWIRAI